MSAYNVTKVNIYSAKVYVHNVHLAGLYIRKNENSELTKSETNKPARTQSTI